MFRVLKYEKTGQLTETSDGPILWQRVARWEDLGSATSMADALKKFPRSKATGYSPVLEFVGKPH